jgi:hypothetical protein
MGAMITKGRGSLSAICTVLAVGPPHTSHLALPDSSASVTSSIIDRTELTGILPLDIVFRLSIELTRVLAILYEYPYGRRIRQFPR